MIAGTSCSICLEELKDPVSIPCGHIHCEKCLMDCIEAGEDAMRALCPTCRSPFSLAVPDMRTIPNKYHVYIDKTIRRVYIPQDATYAATIRNLKADVKKYKKTADALARDKKSLMDRCEAHISRADAIALREQEARKNIDRLKQQLAETTDKYSVLKGKYQSLKHAAAKAQESSDAALLARSASRHAASSSATSVSAPPHVPLTIKRKSGQAFNEDGDQSGDEGADPVVNKRPRLLSELFQKATPFPYRNPRIGPPSAVAPRSFMGYAAADPFVAPYHMRLPDFRERSAGPPPDATRSHHVIVDDDDEIVVQPRPKRTIHSLRPSSSVASATRAASSKRASLPPPPVAGGSRPRGSAGARGPEAADEGLVFEWTDDDPDDLDWVSDDSVDEEPVRGKGKARAHAGDHLRSYVFRGHKFYA